MIKFQNMHLSYPSWCKWLILSVMEMALLSHSLVFAQAATGELRAEVVYLQHCAQCHGVDKRGSPGVPGLDGTQTSWGRSAEAIAQTISHGIRADRHAGTRGGVMPPFKTNAAEFSDDDVRDMAEFITQLRGSPHDTQAALRGKNNFEWCIACHGENARGNVSLGGSNLLAPRLQYGDTRRSLFESIALGRAGVCPPWDGRLTDAEIKSLAHHLSRSMVSHDSPHAPNTP